MGNRCFWAVRMAASSSTRGLWDAGNGSLSGLGGQTDQAWQARAQVPRVSGTAGQPSPVKLGNSGLLTALGMRVCALNEELGLALTSQQAYSSVYKDLVPQGLGGRGRRRICFSQDLGASAAILRHPLSHITSLAHFPLPRNPTRPAPGDGRREWSRANGQAACCSQRSPPHRLWSPVAAASQQGTPWFSSNDLSTCSVGSCCHCPQGVQRP